MHKLLDCNIIGYNCITNDAYQNFTIGYLGQLLLDVIKESINNEKKIPKISNNNGFNKIVYVVLYLCLCLSLIINIPTGLSQP